MTRHTTRRDFLRTIAATGGGYWLTAPAFSADRAASGPNGKLAVACIGIGGQGEYNVNGVKGEAVFGLCDVDEVRAGKVFERFPGVPRFTDFRVMLDKVKPLDAVVVATPDHTHAVAAVDAMRRGKHVYCEKPLAHSLFEVRAMRNSAARMKVATQMGTQLHSEQNYRRAVELVRKGILGEVREAYAWCSKAYFVDKPPTRWEPVPQTLNWDLWLGPVKDQPYSKAYVPFNWRSYRDFGTGGIGDMACHIVDPIATALDLKTPKRITAQGSPIVPISFQSWLKVEYEFPERGNLPPLKLTWFTGDKRPPRDLSDNGKWPDSGCLIIGENGRLLVTHGGGHKLLPEDKFRGNVPASELPPHPGHHQEWIKACKTGSPTGCNFEYASALTETVLLGNVAYFAGKPLEWDSDKLLVTNVPEANDLLRREYRKGW